MKRIAGFVGVLVLLMAGYVGLAVSRMPGPYELESAQSEFPLMPWDDYQAAAADVEPPVIVEAGGAGAALLFFGAEHSNDAAHPQFAELDSAFARFKPTVVLVEGRPGPLLPMFMDSVEAFGESGRLVELAQDAGAKSYIWELSREQEAQLLREKFSPDQAAIFLLMRPFPGGANASDAEANLSAIIDDRSDRPGIDGIVGDLDQFDRKWAENMPSGEDWRELNGVYGAPGFLGEMFEFANDIRDQHMLNIVKELLGDGERVMVTMGWSHTVRVEAALEQMPVSAR